MKGYNLGFFTTIILYGLFFCQPACAQNLVNALQAQQTPLLATKSSTPKSTGVTQEKQQNDNDKVYLTLPDAIAIALRKNPDINKAYLQRINDKYTLKLAKDQFEIVPKFNANFNTPLQKPFGPNQSTNVIPELDWKTTFGTEFDFKWDNSFNQRFASSAKILTITQPLLQGLGTDVNKIDLLNAQDQEIINKLNLKQQIITTVTQIIIDYRTLQQSEMSLSNDKEALYLAEQTVQQTKKRIKAGTVASAEIYQYQSEVAANQLTIQSDLNTLQENIISLANDLGVDPDTHIVVPVTIDIPHVVPNVELSQKLALLNDQTYLTDLINIRKDKRELLKARDSARWKLDLTATVQRTSYGSNNQATSPIIDNNVIVESAGTNDSAGLSLNVPLGRDALANKASIASAKIQYQDDMIDLKNTKRQLVNSIKQKIETINIDLKKLDIAKQSVQLQQRTLKTTTKKVSAGLASGFELTSEQQRLRSSRQNLIQADISYLNDLTDFDQTVGTTLDTWKIKVHY